MSKSKEPRRNGTMPTLTYYKILPSQRPRSCCISRRGRRPDPLKHSNDSETTPLGDHTQTATYAIFAFYDSDKREEAPEATISLADNFAK